MASRYGWTLSEFLKLTEKQLQLISFTAFKNIHNEKNFEWLLTGVKDKDLPKYKDPRDETELAKKEKEAERLKAFEIINKAGLNVR